MTSSELPQQLSAIIDRVASVVRGAEEHVRHCLIAVMARGHVLFEGPPGTAKTLLTQTLARCLGLELRRVQCTPDLMPGDVLGDARQSGRVGREAVQVDERDAQFSGQAA